jgi:hypothetical protein
MNINIVYHKADNDGMFGAYLLNKHVKSVYNNPTINFIGLDYPEMPNFKFRHAIGGELADTYHHYLLYDILYLYSSLFLH